MVVECQMAQQIFRLMCYKWYHTKLKFVIIRYYKIISVSVLTPFPLKADELAPAVTGVEVFFGIQVRWKVGPGCLWWYVMGIPP
jgi:hypothetical protein